MCNVVVFRFTCGHSLHFRRSQCKGTKHKITRSGTKAACTAQSFLTITQRVDCGPCQQTKWESNWKLKRDRAKKFLEKLTEKRMAGIQEIAALVQELEHEYTAALWEAHHTFLQTHKTMLQRVKISDYNRLPSPLPREVLPEDIAEPTKATKNWADMDENDYDGNYVASTDPMHPVSTDYTHPMDDDDGSWLLNHFSPEEMDSVTADEDPFAYDASGWDWGIDTNCSDMLASQPNNRNGESSASKWATNHLDAEQRLVAWRPEAGMPSSTAEISMQGLTGTKATLHQARVAETMKAFWLVVNGTSNTSTESQHHPTTENDQTLTSLLASLDLSDKQRSTSTEPPKPSTLTTPTDSYLWTDGPTDTLRPPTPAPDSFLRPSTPPAGNSTRAKYDKVRKFLKERRKEDGNLKQYHSDWLLVSRCEARVFEGPQGRCVPDPPVAVRTHRD